MSIQIIKVGQKYTLELETDTDDIASATTLEIHYRDPNGVDGQLTATTKVDDDSVATTEITSLLNDTPGTWRFEVYAVIGGGKFYGSTEEFQSTRHFF